MKSVLSRPAEAVVATCTTDPDWRMRPLHRLGKNGDIADLIELAFEVDRSIGPGLANDLHALIHTSGGFSLVKAKFFVFVRFAPFADAKIQPAVRNHVHHGVGLSDVERIVQG